MERTDKKGLKKGGVGEADYTVLSVFCGTEYLVYLLYCGTRFRHLDGVWPPFLARI